MTAGSIVLAYNLKDVPNLKLSREAYVGIFSGKITNGMIRPLRAQIRMPNCRTPRLMWLFGPTAAAPRSFSPST